MRDKYKIWLEDLVTMPGVEVPNLDAEKMVYMDAVVDVPGFDKAKVLAALKIREIAFDERTMPNPETHGYSTEDSIAIKRNTPYPTKILWHELGHVLCKHSKRFGNIPMKERGEAEAEADAVAYLLCNVYQFNAPKAQVRWYVQGWYKGKKITETSKKRIMDATDQIIKANGYVPEVF